MILKGIWSYRQKNKTYMCTCGDRLIVELGFRVGFRVGFWSWIFELDFPVGFSSWIFQLDFPAGFRVKLSSSIFKLVFDLVSLKCRLQTRDKIQTKVIMSSLKKPKPFGSANLRPNEA